MIVLMFPYLNFVPEVIKIIKFMVLVDIFNNIVLFFGQQLRINNFMRTSIFE